MHTLKNIFYYYFIMDNLVFEEAVNAEISDSEFISKKWVYVNDNNSQNYTSQVIIDTTPLANAGGYVNWQEAYMIMPLNICLTSATSASLPANNDEADWSWAFKNGFWQMINSMTVEFNNQNIIQQTPFLNVFRSFKNQTSMSLNDVHTNGAGIGFAMDDFDSWMFTASDTAPSVGNNSFQATTNYPRASGLGLSNNIDFGLFASSSAPTITTTPSVGTTFTGTPYNWALLGSPCAGSPYAGTTAGTGAGGLGGVYGPASGSSSSPVYTTSNRGMFQRQKSINTDNYTNQAGGTSTTAGASASGWNGQGIIQPPSAFTNNYISGKVANTTAGLVQWTVYAKLRLKDLADYFNKVPLLKGSTMRFYINTNQAIVNYTITNGSTDIAGTGQISNLRKLTVNSVSVNGGLTCPLMVTSPTPCSGGSSLRTVGLGTALIPTTETYNLSVSIFRNNFTAQSSANPANTPLTAVRLYAPVYKFNPLAEQRYLSLTPTKKIEYNDFFQYQFSNVAPNTPFNFLVSNGLPNIQSVLVVPFINSAYNGVLNSATNTTTLLSPTTTTGGTPDPIPLSNFNILVSGVNLFLNNEQYDFEAFNQELISSNQLNGNLTTGLTSGLISQEGFSKLYRWYYGNCARVLPSEEGVSRSVQIQGTNTSGVGIDLMVFVEFKKSMTVDISTGARIE